MKTVSHCNGPVDNAGAASPTVGAELREQELAAGSASIASFECMVGIGRLQEELRKQNGDVKAAIVQVAAGLQGNLMKGLEDMLYKLPDDAKLVAEICFTSIIGEVASNLVEYGLAGINGDRTEDLPLSDKDLLKGAQINHPELGLSPDQVNYYQERKLKLEQIISEGIYLADPAISVSCRMDAFIDRLEFRAKDPRGFAKFEEKLAHALDCAQDFWVNVNGGRGLAMLMIQCTDICRDPQDSATIVFSKELGKPTMYERLYPEGNDD